MTIKPYVARAVVLVSMALGLLGFGGLFVRRLVNAPSDLGFGLAVYVLGPVVGGAAVALLFAAAKILRDDGDNDRPKHK